MSVSVYQQEKKRKIGEKVTYIQRKWYNLFHSRDVRFYNFSYVSYIAYYTITITVAPSNGFTYGVPDYYVFHVYMEIERERE